jgi:hypothetical protein
MTGDELRRQIDQLGLHYTEAAGLLGLSLSGLHRQMRGERPVTRQTELLVKLGLNRKRRLDEAGR